MNHLPYAIKITHFKTMESSSLRTAVLLPLRSSFMPDDSNKRHRGSTGWFAWEAVPYYIMSVARRPWFSRTRRSGASFEQPPSEEIAAAVQGIRINSSGFQAGTPVYTCTGLGAGCVLRGLLLVLLGAALQPRVVAIIMRGECCRAVLSFVAMVLRTCTRAPIF